MKNLILVLVVLLSIPVFGFESASEDPSLIIDESSIEISATPATKDLRSLPIPSMLLSIDPTELDPCYDTIPTDTPFGGSDTNNPAGPTQPIFPPTSNNDNGNSLDKANVVVDKVINIGKKIWNVIEAGQPVLNIKSNWATATPQGLKSLMEMDNWKAGRAIDYVISAKNLYGIEVVRMAYRLIYNYDGSYNGTGRYLANVKIVPLDVNVAWLFNVDLTVEITDAYNSGTRENPIGALTIVPTTSISTVLQKKQIATPLYLDGTGKIKTK